MTRVITEIGEVEVFKPLSGSKIHFQTPANGKGVDKTFLMELQRLAGYDPRGYGFSGPTQTIGPDGLIFFRWTCSNSCD